MSVNNQIKEILNEKLRKTIKSGLNDKLLNKIGIEAKQQIVKRTRLGKGVRVDGGSVFNLKSLKKSTIDHRVRYGINLSQFTRSNKSNLTATGQLLDSIAHRIIGRGRYTAIELYFKENRRRELSGAASKITHEKIHEYVSKTRPFFNLAEFEIAKIKSIIINAFKNA